MFKNPRSKGRNLETSVGNEFYLHGRERTRRVDNSHLLEYLEQGLLVPRHDQPGANVYEMIHVRRLIKGGVRQEGPEMARDHARRPEMADERLVAWWHGGGCVCASVFYQCHQTGRAPSQQHTHSRVFFFLERKNSEAINNHITKIKISYRKEFFFFRSFA